MWVASLLLCVVSSLVSTAWAQVTPDEPNDAPVIMDADGVEIRAGAGHWRIAFHFDASVSDNPDTWNFCNRH